MSWLAVIIICATGIVIMDGKGEEENKKETVKYTKEYCRNHLSDKYYNNWDCENIAYQLQDNWLKDNLEYSIRSGYSFERAIDGLIKNEKISL